MRGERFPPDDPREWLNRARSNLAQAKRGATIPEIYLEDLCFDAQQSAEKAIKAVLIHLDIPFPYVHDLARLLTLVDKRGAGFLTQCGKLPGLPGMPWAPVIPVCQSRC